MQILHCSFIINRENKEESADPEDPDDDVPLARLVTALQPHLAEPMTTHEFIDEDADLACQNLSDQEKQFFAELGAKTNEKNGNELQKENELEKEETEKEITMAKALEMVDKLKTYCLRKEIADAHSQVLEIEDKSMNFYTQNLKQSSIISYFNKPVSSSQ